MTTISILRYLAQGFRVSFQASKGVSLYAPPISNKLKGAFDIRFYQLQQKQMNYYIDSHIDFHWNHPTDIIEDDYGIIWYYQKEKDIFWRPAKADLCNTDSIQKNHWIYIDFNTNKHLKHLKQGTPTFHPYPCFQLSITKED